MWALTRISIVVLGISSSITGASANSFVNFETPHVSPVDISPNDALLAVCNTPDNRVEIYNITSGTPQHVRAIQVGMDPVSVRFRTDSELWVVNHVSDSVSVVNVNTGAVTATIDTRQVPASFVGTAPLDFGDEPTDVVFAGSPQMAYISCSQSNFVIIVDPADPSAGATDAIEIEGEEPKAMTVSPNGLTVYVAIFESGNHSTVLGGGLLAFESLLLPNIVSRSGPYAADNDLFTEDAQNPPPNTGGVGGSFNPPIAGTLPTPPKVGLIVKNTGGQWLDDNGQNWTQWVSGIDASHSGRVVGWDVVDNDIAVIDTATNTVTYAEGLMNIVMGLAVNPASGHITAIGTDADNEIRFEPVVNGKFLKVQFADVDTNLASTNVVDLNSHLTYTTSTIPQVDRDKSIGDPRGIVWNAAGTKAYITGMGSNNVITVDQTGARTVTTPIEVPEGPTGLALDEGRNRLYVLNKFAAKLTVIDTTTDTVLSSNGFFDPTPPAIKTGRKHLYDTHSTSGLGQISCGSCHVDARMDRLAWDLGAPHLPTTDPSGSDGTENLGFGISSFAMLPFEPFHPMKGPMTTQTLQDIIGKEPLHWRGDRRGLEEFNPAFEELNGDDEELTAQEMQEFKDFLATIHFPPNPFRTLDNSLPSDVPLPGQFSTGTLAGGAAHTDPMPNGDAQRGLRLYIGVEDFGGSSMRLDGSFNCVTCHTLPLGNGPDGKWNGAFTSFDPIPPDMNGNHHIGMVSVDGSSNISIKIPHLRNDYEKVGMDLTNQRSLSGFGLLHDGSVDSLTSFLSSSAFNPVADQDVADVVAFMLAFSGSDFDRLITEEGFDPGLTDFPAFAGSPAFLPHDTPSLQTSKDAHAAVGKQVTLDSASKNLTLLNDLLAMADNGEIEIIARGLDGSVARGALYVGGGQWQRDQNAEATITTAALLALAGPGTELTFTAVPVGTGIRIGLDRDEDTHYDFTEILAGSDPANPASVPAGLPTPATSGWLPIAAATLALAAASAYSIGRRRRTA